MLTRHHHFSETTLKIPAPLLPHKVVSSREKGERAAQIEKEIKGLKKQLSQLSKTAKS
jgi:hypothetical protein